ncbi:A disintegrin and metalloproteinase with thrombospondin motifs 6-like [Corticium candelabrum]|uniref:A disintegrin and metalloproteinase with thrombospondin motifs 6-like n=1 Tax=Corticium candelabrum TaxID=121492 RepID=UPI002E274084|nr:A disintegrin and metalloproteinase with thrombospondin motifs 6-like [Corticium candelabrum]
MTEGLVDEVAIPPYYNNTVRERRSATQLQEWTVETAVVADHTVEEYHGNDTVTYLLCVMNMVRQLYRHPSIGRAINVVVVKLVLLDKNQTAEAGLLGKQIGGRKLENFCHWQENLDGTVGQVKYDNAVLVTREKVCGDIATLMRDECSLLGIANMRGMCNKTRRCSLNKDNGLAVAFTIAHEMGHNLGMRHDGDSDNLCKPKKGLAMLMAPNLNNESSPFEWSSCSREYLTTFIESPLSHCLERNDSMYSGLTLPTALPLKFADPDRQCQASFGKDFVACQLTICHSGKCVSLQGLPRDQDGGWSSWKDVLGCSRTCGGGIQMSERLCDNPPPSGRGRYCRGERKRFRTCMTALCPVGSRDFRDDQCQSFNGKEESNDGFRYSSPNITWNAVYELDANGRGRCDLTCYSEGKKKLWKIGGNVIDGTRCIPGSPDYCIGGKCAHVGCDHTFDSTMKEDACRVCKGDNSTCRVATGSVEVEARNEARRQLQDIVVIPKGSVHIRVTETTPSFSLLALSDIKSRYFINTKFGRPAMSKDYRIAGTIFFYTDSLGLESLYTLGPTDQDLVVKGIVRNRESMNVTYTFNYPSSRYEWNIKNWTLCSMKCGVVGLQRATLECRRRDDHSVVDGSLCSGQRDPVARERFCNTQKCSSDWFTMPWGKCNRTCGRGYQHRRVSCFLWRSGPSTYTKMHDSACEGPKPSDRKRCKLEKCQVKWEIGNWTKCNSTCGNGTKSRTVKCIEFSDDFKSAVSDDQCVGLRRDKPRTTSDCYSKVSCRKPVPQWKTGSWSECSVTCGQGQRNREVTCHFSTGKPSSECAGERPPDKMACHLLSCRGDCDDDDTVCTVMDDSSVGTWCQFGVIRKYCTCSCAHIPLENHHQATNLDSTLLATLLGQRR